MKNTPILMLVGNAGAGKDTLADILVEKSDGKMIKIAQADPIKRAVMALFGAPKECLWGESSLRNTEIAVDVAEMETKLTVFSILNPQFKVLWPELRAWAKSLPEKVTIRKLCQELGTEVGRNKMPDIWINQALADAERLLAGKCRYTKEEGCVFDENVSYNYVIITDGRFRNEILGVRKVNGTVCKIYNGTKSTDLHPSEAELQNIPSFWFDYTINNSQKDMEDLNSRATCLSSVLYQDAMDVWRSTSIELYENRDHLVQGRDYLSCFGVNEYHK